MLPTGEAGSSKQLEILNERMKSLKASTVPIAGFLMVGLMGTVPLAIKALAAKISTLADPVMAPALLSNVVGPTIPCSMDGVKLMSIKGWTNVPDALRGKRIVFLAMRLKSLDNSFHHISSKSGGSIIFLTSYNGTGIIQIVSNSSFKTTQQSKDFLDHCIDEWEAMLDLTNPNMIQDQLAN